MVEAIILLAVAGALFAWSALATCTLAGFAPTVSLRSQVTGPDACFRLVTALAGLPGVRALERNGNDVLFSVLPTPTSMERGFGMFVVVREVDDGVLLLARSRIPLSTRPGSALRQVEREARTNVSLRLQDGGFPG